MDPEIIVDFVRRRYGHTTFTWAHYSQDGGQTWREIGTPWQAIVPKRSEVTAAIANDIDYNRKGSSP